MKKISYDFYYNSNAISKAMLEQEFGRSWKRKFIRDDFGSYHCGYYRADPRV